jgi:hypothetical protein
MSEKFVSSMFTEEYALLRGGLAIATKTTADLSAVSPARTTTTKMLATMPTLREGSAIGLANTAFSYLH